MHVRQSHEMIFTLKVVRCPPGLTYIFNFLHSGTLVLRAECQSVQVSEINPFNASCSKLLLFEGFRATLV